MLVSLVFIRQFQRLAPRCPIAGRGRAILPAVATICLVSTLRVRIQAPCCAPSCLPAGALFSAKAGAISDIPVGACGRERLDLLGMGPSCWLPSCLNKSRRITSPPTRVLPGQVGVQTAKRRTERHPEVSSGRPPGVLFALCRSGDRGLILCQIRLSIIASGFRQDRHPTACNRCRRSR